MRDVSILFVDDEPLVLEALRRLLMDEPYEVRTCTDPEQALQDIITHAPTVIVADYYMPKMNGPAFLKKVREIDPDIVRMVLTGKPDVTAVLASVKDGAVYRFILKPWDEDELKMNLRQAIDYSSLMGERNRLLHEISRHRKTIEALERSHPGISKLPRQDATGAFVLTRKDLPKRT
jgi:DNA-binding NtrC family response regulator